MSNAVFKYIDESDISFELEILKEPYSLLLWLDYIQHKKSTTNDRKSVISIVNRSVNYLSRSYKLWLIYIDLTLENLTEFSTKNKTKFNLSLEVAKMLNIFEQASVLLNKYPLFWVKYLQFLIDYVGYLEISLIRKTFNLSLQELTIIQHFHIWPLFLSFADMIGGNTCFQIYKRFFLFALKIDEYDLDIKTFNLNLKPLPSFDEIISVLNSSISTIDELVYLQDIFKIITSKPRVLLKMTQSEFDLYKDHFQMLINLSSNYCNDDNNNNNNNNINKNNLLNLNKQIESFFQVTLDKFPDQVGIFTVELGEYFNNQNNQFSAMKLFEKKFLDCLTIKDLTLIFDSYVNIIEKDVTKMSDNIELIENSNDSEKNAGLLKELNDELNLEIDRFEVLLKRRPFLINDVYLRQNKNNAQAWLERTRLYSTDELDKLLDCYSKAVMSINPKKCTDSELLPKIWINYAKIYIDNNDLTTARQLFDTATKVPWTEISQLEDIWCAWINLEIENNDLDQAILIAKHALKLPENFSIKDIDIRDESLSTQVRLVKSLKLWTFYLDLVESSDNFEDTCKAYEEVIDLKIANAMIILNYCTFLEEKGWLEKSFTIFERAIEMFHGDSKLIIYGIYLKKIIQYWRKLNWNIERVREIFENCLNLDENNNNNNKKAEAETKKFYILYADWEFSFGSRIRSLRILKEAIKRMHTQIDKLELYKLLIANTVEIKGLQNVEAVYQDAAENLSIKTPGYLDIIINGFINVEIKLNNIKRAREVLKFASENILKFSKIQKDRINVWEMFKQFELENGDENTYKEMLRFKRYLESTSKPVEQLNDDTTLEGDTVGFIPSSEGPKITTYTMGGENKDNDKNKRGNELKINNDAIDLDMEDFE